MARATRSTIDPRDEDTSPPSPATQRSKHSPKSCTRFLHGHGRRTAADLLATIPADTEIDYYGIGGVVTELERRSPRSSARRRRSFCPPGRWRSRRRCASTRTAGSSRSVVFHPMCHMETNEERGYQRLHGLFGIPAGPRDEPLSSATLAADSRAGRGTAPRTAAAWARRHPARVGRARRTGDVGARSRRGGPPRRCAAVGCVAVLRQSTRQVAARHRGALRHRVRLVLQRPRWHRGMLRRRRRRRHRRALGVADAPRWPHDHDVAVRGIRAVGAPRAAAVDAAVPPARARDRPRGARHPRRRSPSRSRAEPDDARPFRRPPRRPADTCRRHREVREDLDVFAAVGRPRDRRCSDSSSMSATRRSSSPRRRFAGSSSASPAPPRS